MKEIRNPSLGATWFANWLKHRRSELPLRSIVLGAKCSASRRHVGCQIANYLNEFDSQAEGHWHAFSEADLRSYAEDPVCRELILAGEIGTPPAEPVGCDIARITRRLAQIGGAVLEGQHALDATGAIDITFRVCLCADNPPCFGPCHMWLNPTEFSHESLVSIIADSFLDWTSRQRHETGPQLIGGARHARGTRPAPFIAAL